MRTFVVRSLYRKDIHDGTLFEKMGHAGVVSALTWIVSQITLTKKKKANMKRKINTLTRNVKKAGLKLIQEFLLHGSIVIIIYAAQLVYQGDTI
jgi:hypothetical protein